jgi:hypothetical protein
MYLMGWKAAAVLGLLALQEGEGLYTDEERGFSVPIPKGWSLTRSKDVSKYLVMRAPAEARSGATLILAVQDPMKAVFDGQVTLDAFLEEVMKQYPKRFAEYEFVKAEKGKEGENPTLSLYYKYTSSGQRIAQLQHLVWSRAQHWSLSWGCLDSAFEPNRGLFERASKAFRPAPRK